jgi:hypothetical protein
VKTRGIAAHPQSRPAAPLALLALLCWTASAQVLWHDPGKVAARDFAGTAGFAVNLPKPPFTFEREDLSGTQPKIFVHDANGAIWDVKFGNEVKPECFCWRVVGACGYFAEPSFFVPQGQILGFHPIRRATSSLAGDGHFTAARFQLRDPKLKFLAGRNWRWDRNPFAGTPQLDGLKILIMLFSNWDNKDARVGRGGPNTAIFRRDSELIYAFIDWGSGMGRWGRTTGQTDWRCPDFAAQTPSFVKAGARGTLGFGWEGDIDTGFKTGIPRQHAAWLLNYLGQLTDAQLRAGLKASGGTDAEADCFTRGLRARIEELRAATRR